MNDNNWLDDIRSKMAGFETEEPDRLWEGIADRLEDVDAPPAVHVMHAPLRKIAGVAAMLAFALATWMLLPLTDDITAPVGRLSSLSVAPPADGYAAVTVAADPTPPGVIAAVTTGLHLQPTQQHSAPQAETTAESDANPAPEPTSATDPTPVPPPHSNHSSASAPRSHRRSFTPANRQRGSRDMGSRLAFGISSGATKMAGNNGAMLKSAPGNDFASGNLPPIVVNPNIPVTSDMSGDGISVNRGQLPGPVGGVYDVMPTKDKVSPIKPGPERPDFGYIDPNFPSIAGMHHHQPVSVTASVAYRLTPRLSIESGLSYTMLKSDIDMSRDVLGGTQTLHYIGIPVGVRYTFLEWKRLSLYGSASVLTEKCVSGRMRLRLLADGRDGIPTATRDVRVKPLQMSVGASAGVQFDLLPSLGIYAEPDLSYYFDNGSRTQTIYGDHPLNLSLDFGVRFTIGR